LALSTGRLPFERDFGGSDSAPLPSPDTDLSVFPIVPPTEPACLHLGTAPDRFLLQTASLQLRPSLAARVARIGTFVQDTQSDTTAGASSHGWGLFCAYSWSRSCASWSADQRSIQLI